jgi:hypothetical protein
MNGKFPNKHGLVVDHWRQISIRIEHCGSRRCLSYVRYKVGEGGFGACRFRIRDKTAQESGTSTKWLALSLHRTNLVWSAVIRLWRLYLVKAGPFPIKARVCGVS